MRAPLRTVRLPGIVVFALTLAVLAGAALARPALAPSGLLRDFNAFYCAGTALAARRDPYMADPLGRCERAPRPHVLFAAPPRLALPAPLPPYALAPFVAIARLPYPTAGILWSLVLAAAVAVAVAATRRATGLPVLAVAAAFVLGDGYAAAALGQVAPIAVAAIALCAMWLRQGRDEAAALAAACATIEPHLGLPVCVALAFARYRTWTTLAAAGLGCAFASLALAGVPVTLEYLARVVPAHALSEVANAKQFSLTYALHRLGASDAAAVRAGELQYACALVAGVWLGRRIARRRENDAYLAAIPAAFAVLGGPFVHVSQLAAALPAALLLYADARGRARPAVAVATLTLAIPWVQFADLGLVFAPLAAVTATALLASLRPGRPLDALLAGIAALAFVEGCIAALVPGPHVALGLGGDDARTLAEGAWTRYVREAGTANAFALDVAKLPSVAGLIAIAAAGVSAALRPVGRAPRIAEGGKGAADSRRTAFRSPT